VPERANGRHLAILASRGGPLDVLDWGCGTGAYRRPIREHLGHRYVGVDEAGDAADVRADVHELPFRDASFDHVITNAVLEHVADPVRAVGEVRRVLRHGGVFTGSTAFLEPYHLHSHFHLAPDGLLRVFTLAGLSVEGMWPQEGWLVYDSLAAMPGPVSGASRWLLRRIATFERFVRARRWHRREIAAGRWYRRLTPEERDRELLSVTGQIDFLAVKR
jgi:ubiquinone/menaquinone biosynthesis C-methylase UbiE